MSLCPPSSRSDSTRIVSGILDGIVDSAIMGFPAENYDITWNNFESRLSRSFADIYSREQVRSSMH